MIDGIDHAKLLRLATRMVGATDAEDVVQTAYIKVIQRGASFRGEARKQTWAYRIVQRAALDVLRKRRVFVERGALSDDVAHEPPPTTLLNGEVERRLAGLRPQDRAVLLAVAEHGDLDQAAAAMGLTMPAFRTRLHRARMRLR